MLLMVRHRGVQAALWVVLLAFGLDGLVWDAGLVKHAHADGERFHTHRDLRGVASEPHGHPTDHRHDQGPTTVLHDSEPFHGARWTAAVPSEGFLHSHDNDHARGKFFPTDDAEIVWAPFQPVEISPPLSPNFAEPETPRSRGPPLLLV